MRRIYRIADEDVDSRSIDYGPAVSQGPGPNTRWVPAPTTRSSPIRVPNDPAIHLSTAFESKGVAADPDGAHGRAALFLVRAGVFLAVMLILTLAATVLAGLNGVMAWGLDLGLWAFALAAVGTLVALAITVALDYAHSPAGVERYRLRRAARMGEKQIQLQADLYARAIEGQIELLRGRDR